MWRHGKQTASNTSRTVAAIVAVVIAAFVVWLSLALQVAWTIDVIIALVFARYATITALRLSPYVDTFMPHS